MRLTASDIVSLYRPTPCPLRVYLREQPVPEAEPGVFEEILQTLGRRHEQGHLATLGPYEDLSGVRPDERPKRTMEGIRSRVPVIYQGELACDLSLDTSMSRLTQSSTRKEATRSCTTWSMLPIMMSRWHSW